MRIISNLPTPGSDNNTWGDELNTALTELDTGAAKAGDVYTKTDADNRFIHVAPALVVLTLRRAAPTDPWVDGSGLIYNNDTITALRPHPIQWLVNAGAEPTWGTNPYDANTAYGDWVMVR